MELLRDGFQHVAQDMRQQYRFAGFLQHPARAQQLERCTSCCSTKNVRAHLNLELCSGQDLLIGWRCDMFAGHLMTNKTSSLRCSEIAILQYSAAPIVVMLTVR
jgi:hypothetical protein